MTTKPETLESTFDSVTRTYGSFDSYLRDGLKIPDSELAMLRRRLLEPWQPAAEVVVRPIRGQAPKFRGRVSLVFKKLRARKFRCLSPNWTLHHLHDGLLAQD